MGYQINGERLIRNLFTMARFGQNEGGGIDRILGSQADYDTRECRKPIRSPISGADIWGLRTENPL